MSEKPKAKAVFTVLNDKGLHTRPSTEIVKCAMHFSSQVLLSYKNLQVNAKSLLGILMLAAGRGAKIQVEAVGNDAECAVSALVKLAADKFYIKY
jgi:phosphocarrier protein